VKLKRTVYDTADNAVVYSFWDRVFGPKVTADEIFILEARALMDGWDDWFNLILAGRNKRKRRWLLAYLRDGIITVSVKIFDPSWDDDDPYEGMG
jgi:hypothetical protein